MATSSLKVMINRKITIAGLNLDSTAIEVIQLTAENTMVIDTKSEKLLRNALLKRSILSRLNLSSHLKELPQRTLYQIVMLMM